MFSVLTSNLKNKTELDAKNKPVICNSWQVCVFKLFQGFQGRMKPLLLHLLGQFGEGLEDGQTHGEALYGGGNVLLYSTSLHQVLTPRNDLRRRLVQFLGLKKIILSKVS